jgi:hypothetical protein
MEFTHILTENLRKKISNFTISKITMYKMLIHHQQIKNYRSLFVHK